MATEINTEEMYKQIKKQNGEKFAQVIRGDRDHDGNFLGIPNIIHILEFAGHDAEDAQKLRSVLREIYKPTEEPQYLTDKNPLELLDEAGYDAFVVKTKSQKNSIEKYFRSNERLCTFDDKTRHKDWYIIHAVKRGANKIKPSKNPQRQDEYGTSVISIQIEKGGNHILSIKNRYNHTVNDPDATFDNNPDNIIPGLSDSLKKYFNVNFVTTKRPLPQNFRIIGNQFVHFNYEINNIYYGEKHYFKGSEITKLNSNYEEMLDAVILDKRTGKVRSIDQSTQDLSKVLNNEIFGHKIGTKTDKKNGETIINIIDENKNVKELARTKNGCITSLHLYKTSELGKDFLKYNKTLEKLYAPNLKRIGKDCFAYNECLTTLFIPELEEMRSGCFWYNNVLPELVAPNLNKMGNLCFAHEHNIKKLYIPKLETMGYGCFGQTFELTELIAPKLKKIGDMCFCYNKKLEKLYIPELEEIGEDTFGNIKKLRELIAPKLKKMHHNFTYSATVLKTLYTPELESAETDCFNDTKIIQNLYAPKLKITERTPKCILRAIKLAKLKDGIRNVLLLPARTFNGNSAINPQNVRELP